MSLIAFIESVSSSELVPVDRGVGDINWPGHRFILRARKSEVSHDQITRISKEILKCCDQKKKE